MRYYEVMNLPKSCEVNNVIFKKLFYENSNMGSTDKQLFVEVVDKITWLYCLKQENINIPAYIDDIREYTEVEFIEVSINSEHRINRVAEIIMKTIPYPMLLSFKLGDKIKLYVAHQRTNLSDSTKNMIEEFISTTWIKEDDRLWTELNLKKMRFTNYYTLYSDIIDNVNIYNASKILNKDLDISGDDAQYLVQVLTQLDVDINRLKGMIRKETQFNRKVELNIQIKKLQEKKRKVMEDTTNGTN